MKLWIKTLLKDLLAAAVFLALFFFAGREYLNLISSKIRGSGDPIGVVSDVAYYPKRQLAGDEYVYNLSTEDDLYEGDTVSSDSFSSILMNLVDGTEISLENGSRIILSLKDNTIFFDGTISALSTKDREEPLRLINLNEQDAEPIILTQTSEVTISTDEKGVFNMSVLSGEVSRGEEIIEENEQFVLTPAGETTVNKMSFILNQPANNSSWLTFGETQKIRFTWDEPNPAETRSLWIALDTAFERVVYREDGLTDLSFEIDLLPGDYFWRVGDEETGSYSSTGKIRIIDNLPLRATAPTQDMELVYRDQLPEQTFLWQGAESADLWTLEISRDEAMTNPEIRENTRYNQIRISSLDEGVYWWRVTAEYGGMENIRRTSSGEPKKLVVTKLDELLPPRLIAPEGDARVTPADFTEGIRFSWKGDPEIPLYELVISDREDLSNVVFRENTSRNFLDVTTFVETGTYYWRVNPLTDGSIPVNPSETRILNCEERTGTIELIYPGPGEAVELVQGQNLTFRWNSSDRKDFRFHLWKVTGGVEKNIASSRIERTELNQYIAERGDYLWKVDIIDENQEVLLEGTKSSFYVDYPILPPQMIEPQPDSTFSLIGESGMKLSWMKGANSTFTSGMLYREGETEPVLTLTSTESTEAEIGIEALKAGNYTLELQGERPDEGKGFPSASVVSRSSFTIDRIVNYEAPRITSPAEGTVTNRLQILQRGLTVQWESNFDYPNYEVILKQKERDTLLMRRLTNQKRYTIDDVYPDSYTIEVIGRDSQNRPSPTGSVDIEVLAVNPLTAVSVISPVSGQTVDMSDRETLDFSWEQGETGEYYNIALYNRSGDPVFTRERYRNTEFTFSDLTKLDVGEFVFTVEAVKEYNDIGIVRTSPETEISFEITIESIGNAPVILSPDIQYAD